MTRFSIRDYDPEVTEFTRIGQGSVGGKARGIAFMASELHQAQYQKPLFQENMIKIPQTCVIASSGFKDFTRLNKLQPDEHLPDHEVEQQFLAGDIPDWLLNDLKAYLKNIHYPLSVRSSSLLEDARYRPYAGIYHTCMLTNQAPDFNERLEQLLQAVKRVYASTWFEAPRAYSRSIGQTRADAMAVIIQQVRADNTVIFSIRLYPGWPSPIIITLLIPCRVKTGLFTWQQVLARPWSRVSKAFVSARLILDICPSFLR
ncbi:Pyruvate phosphate dikinase, PEP/pyruvate binding domain [Candidatus Electrothrix aarhusensis]|uniref:Pyruvate phosphate dikinase, PEP/pyruvate binding domain n=1 Tax=Candidatus Electrothrix aarhusensis TaxID=1859131 RepID=A0A3S3SPK8_9BACT|nr:Pyruvate phosphate dikinase, PEP/pyruvate binding domain [Candidatus Electrothrix aarhusensis]